MKPGDFMWLVYAYENLNDLIDEKKKRFRDWQVCSLAKGAGNTSLCLEFDSCHPFEGRQREMTVELSSDL